MTGTGTAEAEPVPLSFDDHSDVHVAAVGRDDFRRTHAEDEPIGRSRCQRRGVEIDEKVERGTQVRRYR